MEETRTIDTDGRINLGHIPGISAQRAGLPQEQWQDETMDLLPRDFIAVDDATLRREYWRLVKLEPLSIASLMELSFYIASHVAPDILRVVTLLPPVENATQAIEISWTELGADVDWDRWHELLDIRDNRGLNAEEQTEYDRLAIIAARLDQQEELATAYAVSSLEDRHQQVIASIERLVEAVREVGHQE